MIVVLCGALSRNVVHRY